MLDDPGFALSDRFPTLERHAFHASELVCGPSKLFATNLYLAVFHRVPDPAGYHFYEVEGRDLSNRPNLVRRIAGSEEAARTGVHVEHDIVVVPELTPAEHMSAALALFSELVVPVMARRLQGSPGHDGVEQAFQLIVDRNFEQVSLLESEVAGLKGRLNRAEKMIEMLLREGGARVPGSPQIGSMPGGRPDARASSEIEARIRHLNDGFDSLHAFVTGDLQTRLIDYVISLVSISHERTETLASRLFGAAAQNPVAANDAPLPARVLDEHRGAMVTPPKRKRRTVASTAGMSVSRVPV